MDKMRRLDSWRMRKLWSMLIETAVTVSQVVKKFLMVLLALPLDTLHDTSGEKSVELFAWQLVP